VITEIYAASEQPIPGVSGEKLLAGIKKHGQKHALYVENINQLPDEVLPLLCDEDIVLTLGAGNIYQAGEEILERLAKQGDWRL
jgi:UDP-N-acetylmuramate--alanine ligase